jgi:hypothetical protein
MGCCSKSSAAHAIIVLKAPRISNSQAKPEKAHLPYSESLGRAAPHEFGGKKKEGKHVK